MELPSGTEVKIPAHRASTRLKIAWRAAVDMLSVEEEYLKILRLQAPDGSIAGPLLVANLNLALAELDELEVLGARVSLGKCNGQIATSLIKFCADEY